MNEPPTIKAYRVGAFSGHEFKPYTYGGDEPYIPPVVQPSKGNPCSAEGCARAVHAKGLCGTHYSRHRNGVESDRRRKPFDPSKCGTPNGYNNHKYHGVEVCRPCRDAKNKYERQTYARRMGAGK